ncbi:MAG: hypothetical protein ACRELS_00115, partial [Candidatus Rokuibacteriota bacterium]
MSRALRVLARRVLGVRRVPTYYLPWLTRPGLECALVLHNVEARFKAGWNEGPFPLEVIQYGADGGVVRRRRVELRDNMDTIELPVEPVADGCGFVSVACDRLLSNPCVTLTDGHDYTATHGRGEFVEHYPLHARLLLALLGRLLAAIGHTLPAFVRDQYVYLGAESRSHVLLLNLSTVTNRVRLVASGDGASAAARLVALPPLGARLVNVA